ncbi:MAG: putative toxin-antitoxin system toxin component, PIN family [Treponema sp.]|jgi:putative PIN family toxin of toxin-antitoxin system|nr:putative toxin-antitoxin system toxin component, PIN family [Treponema sp.]
MKLVLDTNIFISAFYWGGNPQKVIDGIIEGMDTLFISNEILDEVAAVMTGSKFKTGPEIIERYIRTIEKIGKKVFIAGKIKGICRDKNDDDKIECGVLSGADYLITGDDDLLVLESYQQMKITTANEYLKIVNSIFSA